MSRRKLYREKVANPDAGTAARYLLILPRKDLYEHPEGMPPVTSMSLFGNEHPIELEIGCGSGEFLCWLALRHPETNYIGVELRRKSLHEAIARASAMALKNILFVNTDARLFHPLLVAESLRAVYLHFPDPVTRPKFRKRQIFTERFLDSMHEAMTVNGRLSVMTDHQGSFEEMLQMVERDDRWCKTHRERFLEGFEVETKSRFQRIWEGHGLTTLRFEVMKRGDHG
jgi:tRNA (guanine-N7-)-methyltransferase